MWGHTYLLSLKLDLFALYLKSNLFALCLTSNSFAPCLKSNLFALRMTSNLYFLSVKSNLFVLCLKSNLFALRLKLNLFALRLKLDLVVDLWCKPLCLLLMSTATYIQYTVRHASYPYFAARVRWALWKCDPWKSEAEATNRGDLGWQNHSSIFLTTKRKQIITRS